MPSLASQFEGLKTEGEDRRRELPKTIEMRQPVHQETLKEGKVPPRHTMENRTKLEAREGLESKDKPQPKPRVGPPISGKRLASLRLGNAIDECFSATCQYRV